MKSDDMGLKGARDTKMDWSNEHPHQQPSSYYGEAPIDKIHDKRDKAAEHHPPQAFWS